jgi:hypothetical protein
VTVGQEHQDLFDDPAPRRGTLKAVDDFARQWREGPVQRLFDAAIADAHGHGAESIAQAIRGLFADHGWAGTLIDALGDQLRADPMFSPPFRTLANDILKGLLVYTDRQVAIAASVIDVSQLAAKKSARRGSTSINFSGRLSVFKFVRSGDALLSFWEAPEITAGFTGTEAGQCRRTGERRMADGDIVTVDGRTQSYAIEHARSNIFLVQAEIMTDQAPLSVEYDSASLGFVGCSANDDTASRIQMITTLLRKLACEGAFESVAAFLDYPDFFVRWHVMKELLGIDAEAAMPHLRRMAARDPHSDVRRTARAVLDRLEGPHQSKAA